MERSIDNDTRGWIMCVISAAACILGACIICTDVFVRSIWKNSEFQIQKSSAFLAASMSLSFGVMTFSSLYSMLPSSKKYLLKAGFSSSDASWILLVCFVAGVLGIEIVSRFLHGYMPSHVESCDHTHKAEGEEEFEDVQEHTHTHEHEHHHHEHDRAHSHSSHGRRSRHNSHNHRTHPGQNGKPSESTPLLVGNGNGSNGRPSIPPFGGDGAGHSKHGRPANNSRRPSMAQVQQRVLSFVKDTKANCDGQGPCYGYSDPCGKGCFKHLSPRSSVSRQVIFSRSSVSAPHSHCISNSTRSLSHSPTRSHLSHATSHDSLSQAASDSDLESQLEHHHHVPDHAYMNLGVQTSIAIALHKLPEGFITYATNHANPSLGFSVFMALFVHNITEGFALALPLFLATNSRLKAIAWASLLGGISQPLGAGIAAVWFGISANEPGTAVYGCMFGVTAGIMVYVALNLLVEGVGLQHGRGWVIGWAVVGMGIMGGSNALTAR